MDDPATNTPASPQPANSAQRRALAIDQIIATLSELFPATFVAERWRRHSALKIGIDRDLVERGVLTPAECRRLFARYCGRRAYQLALVRGGWRVDLDGQFTTEVAADERQAAADAIARMDARTIEKVAAGKAVRKAERAAKRAAERAALASEPHPQTQHLREMAAELHHRQEDSRRTVENVRPPTRPPASKPPASKPATPTPAAPKPSPPKPPASKPALQLVPAPADARSKRLGLADLKRAAQARREHAGGPEPPRAA